MFSNSGSIQQAMERLVCAKDSQSFQVATGALREQMNEIMNVNESDRLLLDILENYYSPT